MNRKDIAILVFLLLTAAAVYAPALPAPFIFDDHEYIVDNAFIRSPSRLPLLFSPRDYFVGTRKPRFRPLSATLYFAGYGLWGLNPIGHRLLKIAIHFGNSWLVYLLFLRLLREKEVPLLAALIFLLHPVQTEAVDCVAFNDDLLACGFLLISLILMRRAPSRAAFWGGLLSYLAALFSKEIALVFLPLYLIQEYSFPSRRSGRLVSRLFPIILVTAGYLALRFLVFAGPETETATPTGGTERVVFIARVAFHYLRLLIFPIRLSLDYSPPIRALAFAAPPLAIFIVGSLLFLATLRRVSASRRILWAAGWLAIPLLPALHLVPLPQVLAERYLYIPAIGFAALFALFLGALRRRKGVRPAAALVLLFFFLLAFSRNRVWNSPEALWRRSLRISPMSSVAHNNLGWDYYLTGDLLRAEEEYRSALSGRPSPRVAAIAHANLGIIREAGKDYGRALKEILIARALRPDSARVHRQEGQLRLLRREYREASESLLRVLELNPYDYESYSLMGCVMAEIGHLQEAENYFRRSLNLNPDYQAARDNLRQLEEKGR